MKRYLLFLGLSLTFTLQAQAPQGFNYQATVRNSAGDLIVNTNVYFKFNVMQGSQTSLPVFTEIHYVPTDDLGQVNLIIGQGTATTGAFSELDWSLGSYYLGIELDTGNGYVAMGTTQLLSVPYALYAENSGNSTPTTPNLETVLGENNSANNQQIKDLQDPTEAQDAVTKAYVDTEVLNNVQNIEQVLTQGNDANGLQLKGLADPTEAQDAVTLAYITQLETSLQDLQNQLQEQNQNIDNDFDGFSENNGDCDDTNAQVYSGAEEICDGLDNDCDGLVDEDAGSIFYQDSDGDGFGGSTTIQSCTQPSGYVVQNGDCDDSDATINPNASEICNGIDENCDGTIDDNCTLNIDISDKNLSICSIENSFELLTYDGEGWDINNIVINHYEQFQNDIFPEGTQFVWEVVSSTLPDQIDDNDNLYSFISINIDANFWITEDNILVLNVTPVFEGQVAESFTITINITPFLDASINNPIDDLTINSGESFTHVLSTDGFLNGDYDVFSGQGWEMINVGLFTYSWTSTDNINVTGETESEDQPEVSGTLINYSNEPITISYWIQVNPGPQFCGANFGYNLDVTVLP